MTAPIVDISEAAARRDAQEYAATIERGLTAKDIDYLTAILRRTYQEGVIAGTDRAIEKVKAMR